MARFEQLILPEGEEILWQGRPTAPSVALRIFHVRLVAAYFALLFAGRILAGAFQHQPWQDNLAVASRLVVPAAITFALLGLLSYIYSRTTRYTLTNRRVLLQFGAVLKMALNVPYKQVTNAGVRLYRDGSGDIPLAVSSEKRLAYLLLWPHVRPWRLNKVEPMLRSVPDAEAVAALLGKALAEASPQAPEPVTAVAAVPRPVQVTSAIASAA